MIIKLKAKNIKTGDVAEYEMGARHYGAAVEAMRHFLRGRGWSEEQVRTAELSRS